MLCKAAGTAVQQHMDGLRAHTCREEQIAHAWQGLQGSDAARVKLRRPKSLARCCNQPQIAVSSRDDLSTDPDSMPSSAKVDRHRKEISICSTLGSHSRKCSELGPGETESSLMKCLLSPLD